MWILPLPLFAAALWCTCDGAEIGKAVTTTGKTTPSECGQSSLSIPKEKVVGANAALGNFPWLATTFQKDSDSGKWRPSCAGTLVSPSVVLTVAHCFENVPPEDLRVALGKSNRDYYQTEPTEVKREVTKIHVHGRYKKDDYSNDIATLILDAGVFVSAAVMPACLATQNLHATHTPEVIQGFVTSWGNTDNCTVPCDIQNRPLTYSRVSTQDYNSCYSIAKATSAQLASLIASDKFCSDYVVYRGDSGAPLTFAVNNTHYLYGIASGKFSVNSGGKPQHHTLFTNVTHHMDWIKSNLS